MKIAIVAGGTGGHFYPGLSVAKKAILKGHRVQFFVRSGDLVIPMLERENIPFKCISAGGFRRKFDLKNVLTLIKLAWGFLWSFLYLLINRPRVIIAMGGYLSVPPTLAGRIQGIPVLLHEQNAIPGLANRLLSRMVSKVALSFEQSNKYFSSHKTIVTGNPIRPEFDSLPTQSEARKYLNLKDELFTILVFGGSQGAQKINELMAEVAPLLQENHGAIQILHYTGQAQVDLVEKKYQNSGIQSQVKDYCHDMVRSYAAADLVVSRAGASTVFELMAVKKPAILIPYPFATDHHQSENAKKLKSLGLADVYEQKDLDRVTLLNAIGARIQNRGEKVSSSFSYNPAETTQRILTELENLGGMN